MGKDGDVDDTKVDTPPKRGDALGDWSTPQGMIQAVKKAKGLGKAIPRELAQALASTLKGMKGKGKGLHQGERETAMPSFEPVASSGWLHTKRLGKQNHHSAENKRDEVEAIEDSQPSCDGEKRKPEPTDEETPDKRAEVPKRMKKKIPDQEEAEAVPEESKQKKKKKKDEELDENGEALNGKESQAKKKKKPIADEADADLEMEPPKMKKPKNDGGVSGDRLHDGPKKKRGDAHDDKEEAQPRKAKVPRGIQAEEPEAEVMTPTEKQAKRKEKNKKANEIQEGDMADLSKQMETEAMQVAMYGSVPIDVAEGEEGGQDLDGEELDLEDWEHQELLVDDREGVPSQGLMDVEGMSAEAIREAKSTPANARTVKGWRQTVIEECEAVIRTPRQYLNKHSSKVRWPRRTWRQTRIEECEAVVRTPRQYLYKQHRQEEKNGNSDEKDDKEGKLKHVCDRDPNIF